MTKTHLELERHKRETLRGLYNRLTDGQKDTFHKCFDHWGGIDKMDDSHLNTAISLCDRTLEKHAPEPEKAG